MGRIAIVRRLLPWVTNDPVMAKYIERLEYVEQNIEEMLEQYKEHVDAGEQEEAGRLPVVEEIEFYRLDSLDVKQQEINEIKRRIDKLARKLATRYSRRYRKAKHGKIDLQRTMKSAFSTGGIPIHLRHRVKKVRKPDLILLCDVSRSVAPFSEFMLQLVYALQNKLSSVRTFLFVDIIDEVTEYFSGEDYEEAIKEAFNGADFSRTGVSDFGKIFSIFVAKYISEVPRSSTMMILGDARNNLYPSRDEYLETISRHVKRLIWLNPQPREEWDQEDNIMSTYAPYCQYVFECRNLKQLEEFINADVIF